MFPWTPLDIEELHSLGRKHETCPYYTNRIRADKADIVLMVYNYILDFKIRQFMRIDVSNDVIIIDEAHNMPDLLERSTSFQISETTCKRALAEIKSVE